MAVVAEPPAGGTRRRSRGLHRTPRAEQAGALFSPGTLLGDLEEAVRVLAPIAIDDLAELLELDASDVAKALDQHPMLYSDGAGFWRCLAKVPPDFAAPNFTAEDLASTPREAGETVTCPACGVQHVVTVGVRSKISRGLRTARCTACAENGRAPHLLTRPPLPRGELVALGRWWFETALTDTQILEIALVLGATEPSIANVAAWRKRLA